MTGIPLLPLGSTDKTIPAFGFGTAEYPFAGTLKNEIILHAINLGYRHFDTAALYQSEAILGEAISDALQQGLIKSREELFITSKLCWSDAHRERVVPALRRSLKNLKLEYLDLYLIHFPVAAKPSAVSVIPEKEDLLPIDLKSVWEGMEECQMLGLTKSIGVSNFSCKKLGTLLATAKIPPAANQVEMNPLWQQKNLRKFCQEKGISFVAYSPLGAKGTVWGSNRVMECEELKEIAKAKRKSLVQICLRWVYEQEVVAVVKSFNQERMEENLGIFDWALSPEESEKISQLPQSRGSLSEIFITENGPYKTAEELWDGEI